MHTDSGMTGISLSGYMPYMTVASLEMSDEPLFCQHCDASICRLRKRKTIIPADLAPRRLPNRYRPD